MSNFAQNDEEETGLDIDVRNMTFGYPGQKIVLHDLNMQLARGSRCLLIGANGAGKSTLLRILAGKHLVKPQETTLVLGRESFYDRSLNFERAYLDTDWGMRTVAFAGYGCPLQADIAVHSMMKKLQADYPERREELLKMLGIDINWRMHMVSDGQRRRVQIFLGLLRPFKILLLDEVTVSLDVVVRQDLLRWLRKESETRGATILYATHIFDGLDDWPSHIHYLTNKGVTGWQGKADDHPYLQELRAVGDPSPLLRVAERWLRSELQDPTYAEAESGQAALIERDPMQNASNSAGGFSAGRMAAYDFINGK